MGNKLMKEIIDADGSIINGDKNDSDTEIRTNYYKKSGRPQTSDDFAKEAGQDSKWYYYHRGYSYGVAESEIKEEEIISGKNDTDILNKDITVIPNLKELTKSYQKPDLEAIVKKMINLVNSFASDDIEGQDIQAIVLKEIIKKLPLNGLRPEQKRELKSLFK